MEMFYFSLQTFFIQKQEFVLRFHIYQPGTRSWSCSRQFGLIVLDVQGVFNPPEKFILMASLLVGDEVACVYRKYIYSAWARLSLTNRKIKYKILSLFVHTSTRLIINAFEWFDKVSIAKNCLSGLTISKMPRFFTCTQKWFQFCFLFRRCWAKTRKFTT